MQRILLEAKRRELKGKASARLRKSHLIPAVLYGHHVTPVSLAVDERDFARLYPKVGESTLVDLAVEGNQPVRVLIHDIQDHPVTGQPIHVDFYQVRMDEKITAEIPLAFKGESAAVKELGGVLVKNLDRLKVSCLPGDLVAEIPVDTTTLKTFNDAIRIRDLALPKGLEILEKKELVIATAIPPRSEEELKALEEKPEESVEAVEKVEKKEKEEEAVPEAAEAQTPEKDSKEKTKEQ